MLEVVVTTVQGTYRGVYTVRHEGVVFVLHVFQKKSTQGIKTNQSDIDLIKKRLQDAKVVHEEREHQKKGRTT